MADTQSTATPRPAAAPAPLGLPASVDETHALLANGRYVADRSLATVLYLALTRQRPLFLEGEAGVGTDPPAPETPPRPVLPRTASDRGLPVFRAWLVIYGVVGAQMGWILRPFVGSPDLPFELFRQRESNFLQGLINALTKLFS